MTMHFSYIHKVLYRRIIQYLNVFFCRALEQAEEMLAEGKLREEVQESKAARGRLHRTRTEGKLRSATIENTESEETAQSPKTKAHSIELSQPAKEVQQLETQSDNIKPGERLDQKREEEGQSLEEHRRELLSAIYHDLDPSEKGHIRRHDLTAIGETWMAALGEGNSWSREDTDEMMRQMGRSNEPGSYHLIRKESFVAYFMRELPMGEIPFNRMIEHFYECSIHLHLLRGPNEEERQIESLPFSASPPSSPPSSSETEMLTGLKTLNGCMESAISDENLDDDFDEDIVDMEMLAGLNALKGSLEGKGKESGVATAAALRWGGLGDSRVGETLETGKLENIVYIASRMTTSFKVLGLSNLGLGLGLG